MNNRKQKRCEPKLFKNRKLCIVIVIGIWSASRGRRQNSNYNVNRKPHSICIGFCTPCVDVRLRKCFIFGFALGCLCHVMCVDVRFVLWVRRCVWPPTIAMHISRNPYGNRNFTETPRSTAATTTTTTHFPTRIQIK